MPNTLTFTDEEIDALSAEICDMAVLWNEPMPTTRLKQYLRTLTMQNRTITFARLMRSIELARMQDHAFPMPADILQREVRSS